MIKRVIAVMISLCSLLTSVAWGEKRLPLDFERHFLYQNEQIVVKSTREASEVSVQVLRGKIAIFHRKSEVSERRLRRISFTSPLLFLFWKAGVHGEVLVVLDVEKKKIVWEQYSTWPMELTIQKDKAQIDYTGKQLEGDKYEEFSKILYL